MDDSPRRKEFEAWYRGNLTLNTSSGAVDHSGHPYYTAAWTRQAWAAWSTSWNTATVPPKERRGYKAEAQKRKSFYG